MNAEVLAGLLIVILLGFLVGTMTWRIMVTRRHDFEHQWFEPVRLSAAIASPSNGGGQPGEHSRVRKIHKRQYLLAMCA